VPLVVVFSGGLKLARWRVRLPATGDFAVYSAFCYYFLARPVAVGSVVSLDRVTRAVMSPPSAVSTGPGLFELGVGTRSHSIAAVHADSDGNYASGIDLGKGINLIDITGSKQLGVELFVDPLLSLVQDLRWELLDEEDEDGNEMVSHWRPY